MANKTKPKKPVKCSICGKSYIGKDALIDHIGRIHTSMIPDGWSPARYENYLRTGKTEGHCVYCKTSTTWNEATGKYNRMCGSEKCKKTAKEIANINYIGKHGKPYSINNPEQQKKMVYGRKNSGKYIFEDEVTGKKYVAMYDSSYGKDFFEMLDTLLNWDGADIIAPSPHTYYYEYEGRKHFYIPDAYSTSLNLEIEIKDGGDNPNNHPKIQAVDKVKEKLKDEVMESLKGEVNYIKICNKDYTEFFAMLSRLREQDTCKLPKWESKLEPALESVTEVGFIYPERLDKFKYYHLETEKKDHPGGWDEEQYFKTLKDAVLQELSHLSYKDIGERKGKATRYVYTLGKDYKAIYLGCINIYWYDWYDRYETPDFEWEETSDINKALIDWELNPIVESCDGRLQPELIPVFYDELKRDLNNESVDESTNFSKKKNLVKRYDLLVNPTINYDDLMDYYRKQIFHRNLSKNDRVALYNELNNVRTYLKKVVNGDSENDYRMNYEAKKALKEINGFIGYMEDNQLVTESWDEKLDSVLLSESSNIMKETFIINPGYEEFSLTPTHPEPVADKLFGNPEDCTTDAPGKIATAGDFKEYRQYADLDAARGPIKCSLLYESFDEATMIESMESSITATKSDIQYHPVFIFLSYTDTRMARMIKAFTHDPYSHSSISFDTSLNNMVSFNRDGMVNEDIMNKFFKERSNVVRYSLYMYMATAQEYTAMQNFVNELLGKRDTLKYNLLGLTNFIFGRGSEREDRYFCSEFVASVISAGNDHIIDRKPYMVSPYYFAKNKNFIFIKTGLLKNYDENEVNNIISKKLEKRDFDVTIE